MNEGLENIKNKLKGYDDTEILDETVDGSQTSRQLKSFCKENLYFVYELLVEDVTSNQALAYIVLRQPNSEQFIDAMDILLSKMCGILFKDVNVDERLKTQKIEIKRRLNGNADPVEEKIEDHYPPSKWKMLIFRIKL